MARNSHHIVPDSQGGWNIKRGGSDCTIRHFARKKEAVDAGRIISRNQKTELVIHGLNGKIQSSDSHGHDPCPPRDK